MFEEGRSVFVIQKSFIYELNFLTRFINYLFRDSLVLLVELDLAGRLKTRTIVIYLKEMLVVKKSGKLNNTNSCR